MKKVLLGEQKSHEREIDLREVDYGAKDMRWFIGDTEFDGHHVLWGFEFYPYTYMKDSELSGSEYRKAGWIRFFRNRVQVYEEFCRTSEAAAAKIPYLLMKLQGFDWHKLKEGTRIWYQKTPATIGHIILEQGAFMVHPDGVDKFPNDPWNTEEWQNYEDATEVKVDIFDKNIWWWRREPQQPVQGQPHGRKEGTPPKE